MRRLALAIAAASLATAAPALAGGLPPDLPHGGTLVIDDRDPNFITFTATGFAGGVMVGIGTAQGGTVILPSPGGSPASLTLPDVVGGPDPFSSYVVRGIALVTTAPTSTSFNGFIFTPPFAPLEGTSLFLANNVDATPIDVPPYAGEFIGEIGVGVLPAIWPAYGTIDPQTLGLLSLRPQDGHSETILLMNGEVTVTFITEPVPEPATLALLGAGLLGLAAARRRR